MRFLLVILVGARWMLSPMDRLEWLGVWLCLKKCRGIGRGKGGNEDRNCLRNLLLLVIHVDKLLQHFYTCFSWIAAALSRHFLPVMESQNILGHCGGAAVPFLGGHFGLGLSSGISGVLSTKQSALKWPETWLVCCDAFLRRGKKEVLRFVLLGYNWCRDSFEVTFPPRPTADRVRVKLHAQGRHRTMGC